MIFDTALPIDEALAPLKAALAARNVAVLMAPPGAGKTTRVPLALKDEGIAPVLGAGAGTRGGGGAECDDRQAPRLLDRLARRRNDRMEWLHRPSAAACVHRGWRNGGRGRAERGQRGEKDGRCACAPDASIGSAR